MMMEWEAVSITVSEYALVLELISVLDGFFDAGMLLHALKGVTAEREHREKPAKRRFVGKKLHLNEY